MSVHTGRLTHNVRLYGGSADDDGDSVFTSNDDDDRTISSAVSSSSRRSRRQTTAQKIQKRKSAARKKLVTASLDDFISNNSGHKDNPLVDVDKQHQSISLADNTSVTASMTAASVSASVVSKKSTSSKGSKSKSKRTPTSSNLKKVSSACSDDNVGLGKIKAPAQETEGEAKEVSKRKKVRRKASSPNPSGKKSNSKSRNNSSSSLDDDMSIRTDATGGTTSRQPKSSSATRRRKKTTNQETQSEAATNKTDETIANGTTSTEMDDQSVLSLSAMAAPPPPPVLMFGAPSTSVGIPPPPPAIMLAPPPPPISTPVPVGGPQVVVATPTAMMAAPPPPIMIPIPSTPVTATTQTVSPPKIEPTRPIQPPIEPMPSQSNREQATAPPTLSSTTAETSTSIKQKSSKVKSSYHNRQKEKDEPNPVVATSRSASLPTDIFPASTTPTAEPADAKETPTGVVGERKAAQVPPIVDKVVATGEPATPVVKKKKKKGSSSSSVGSSGRRKKFSSSRSKSTSEILPDSNSISETSKTKKVRRARKKNTGLPSVGAGLPPSINGPLGVGGGIIASGDQSLGDMLRGQSLHKYSSHDDTTFHDDDISHLTDDQQSLDGLSEFGGDNDTLDHDEASMPFGELHRQDSRHESVRATVPHEVAMEASLSSADPVAQAAVARTIEYGNGSIRFNIVPTVLCTVPNRADYTYGEMQHIWLVKEDFERINMQVQVSVDFFYQKEKEEKKQKQQRREEKYTLKFKKIIDSTSSATAIKNTTWLQQRFNMFLPKEGGKADPNASKRSSAINGITIPGLGDVNTDYGSDWGDDDSVMTGVSMASSVMQDDDDDEEEFFCPLGLFHQTPHGEVERENRHSTIVHRVLMEQDRQQKQRKYQIANKKKVMKQQEQKNLQLIAKASKLCSLASVKEATYAGRRLQKRLYGRR